MKSNEDENYNHRLLLLLEKAAPLIACIVDPRFKDCKFLCLENHVQVKATLTGLIC